MKYGCIGEKLGHSFSKEIHTQLFDYDYELCEIKREKLAEFMHNRDFLATNVTIPYKEQVIKYLDAISETARKIGAVNTIVNKNGILTGYNTDFSGMTALILKNNISLENKKVLILGSGGTSRTALAVAQELKASQIFRVSRTEKEGCITYSDVEKLHLDAQVIINTTPCGMFPNIDESPINVDKFAKLEGLVDAVYNPLRSKLVCDARKKGVKAVGGLYMLVAQAAFAAEKFVEKSVDPEKIDEIYHDLVRKKQTIVLIGMPGCGKSTVGKQLAKGLDVEFIDTDKTIEEINGKTIPQIFADSGEAVFRDIESKVIKELSKKQGVVIATGGGAVLRKENIASLSQNGRLYFLDRSLSSLIATDDRPLSSNRQDLEKRYAERYDIYCSCCDKHIKASDSISENVQMIKEDFYNENTCD